MFRLKKLREEKGLSLDDLVSIFNINKSTLSRYENNLREAKQSVIVELADYFGVSTDYLLGRTDDPGQKTEPAPQNESKELELTQKELELINILRRTPPAQQEAVLNLLLSLSKGKE